MLSHATRVPHTYTLRGQCAAQSRDATIVHVAGRTTTAAESFSSREVLAALIRGGCQHTWACCRLYGYIFTSPCFLSVLAVCFVTTLKRETDACCSPSNTCSLNIAAATAVCLRSHLQFLSRENNKFLTAAVIVGTDRFSLHPYRLGGKLQISVVQSSLNGSPLVCLSSHYVTVANLFHFLRPLTRALIKPQLHLSLGFS